MVPVRQSVWGWPAVANLTLVGAGAGCFLLAALLRGLDDEFRLAFSGVPLLIVAPGVALLGVLALTPEVGRPWRARWLLVNLRHSWMSREVLAMAVFLPVSAVACFVAHPAWWTAGSAAAAALIISQGFMFRHARGVPAWNRAVVPVVFLTSALSTAAGVLLIASAVAGHAGTATTLLVVTGCLAADATAWVSYATGTRDAAFRRATAALRQPSAIATHIGLSRVAPALLLVGAALWSSGGNAELRAALLTGAGVMAAAGGFILKSDLVRVAGSLQGIELQLAPTGEANHRSHG